MIVILISILLDGLLTLMLPMHNVLLPLFTIIALLLIYPKHQKHYSLYVILAGIIYDLLYSDIFLLNVLIFIILNILIKYLYKDIPDNYLSLTYRILIVIIFYRLISYSISLLFGNSISIHMLYDSIKNSVVMNLIYGYFLYEIYHRNYN